MRCPVCQSKTRVIYSRFSKREHMTRRGRRCVDPACNYRFKTREGLAAYIRALVALHKLVDDLDTRFAQWKEKLLDKKT